MSKIKNILAHVIFMYKIVVIMTFDEINRMDQNY